MQDNLKVITSAQSFGYGPSSKLVTAIKELRRITGHISQIDFWGDSTSLTYVTQNRKYFDSLFEGQKNSPDLSIYNLAISVMDPYLAIKAPVLNKPIIYIDSLFWFWKWNQTRFDELNNTVDLIKSLRKIDNLDNILSTVGPHELQYIAHRVSNYSVVQAFGQYDRKSMDIFRRQIDVTIVNPIIDKSIYKTGVKKDTILISLSGMISPLVDNNQATKYVKLICNLFREYTKSVDKKFNVILTTNPDVISKINFDTGRIKAVALSNEEILNMLNRSIICFAPVGITFLYEALNYYVPIVFLPEQHDGHYPNYLRLLHPDQKVKDLRQIFPEMLFNTRLRREVDPNPDEEIELIQNLINTNYLGDTELIKQMSEVANNTISMLSNTSKTRNMLNRQRSQLLGDTQLSRV